MAFLVFFWNSTFVWAISHCEISKAQKIIRFLKQYILSTSKIKQITDKYSATSDVGKTIGFKVSQKVSAMWMALLYNLNNVTV